MNTKNPNINFWLEQLTPSWVFYIIIAVGAFLRLVALKSDPPLDLARGQSLWTDPSQYVFFARNFVNFGRMDSFIPSGLIFFKYSFISFLSIPFFYILGSGFWQSNLISSVISIATIIIFGLTIKKSMGNFVGSLVSLFACTAYIYVMHNRVPYLENASLLFLVLSTFFFILRYESKYGLITSGLFLACSLLIGKILAVMTIPAFVLAMFLIERQEGHQLKMFFTRLIYLLIGFLGFTLIALVLFFMPNYLSSREYLAENVINYYGFPEGLKSFRGFIQSLYTFDLINFENKFFDRLPIITICAILFLYVMRIKKRGIETNRALILFCLWFVGSYVFLSPWNYRPIRYEMYMVLPMITLASVLLYDIVSGDLKITMKRMAIGIMPMSIVSFHFYFNLSNASQGRILPFWRIFGYSLFLGVIISLTIFYIFKGVRYLRSEIRAIAVLLIIAFSLSFDIRYFINWAGKLTYAIDYANRNLKSELSDKAVIMGSYAQTLTLGTSNKAVIFYFGAYPKDDSLFAQIPATHVIYEVGMGGSKSGNEAKFAEYYSKVNAGSQQIDSYLIGRYYVNLFNVSKSTDNISAKDYKMTDFEKGMCYYNRNDLDSALIYFNLAEKSENGERVSLYKGNIYYKQEKYEIAKRAYAKGLADDCYDPKFWALYSLTCKQTGDNGTAERAEEKALKYAPFPGFFQNIRF